MDVNKIAVAPLEHTEPLITISELIVPILSLISIILGIISIILIVKALDKKKDAKALIIWILMYIISFITRIMPKMIYSYGRAIDYEPTFWDIYGDLIIMLITLVIRIIMIIYPIYIIIKNKKKTNKS